MKFSIVILTTLLLSIQATGGSITRTVRFDPSMVTVDISGQWNIVQLEGLELRGAPGVPLLPVSPEVFLLPSGADNIEFKAVPVTRISIGGDFVRVIPAMEPRPFCGNDLPSVLLPDPQVYSLNSTWPADPVLGTHTGSISGFRIASCLLQPWEYIPSEGRLSLVSEMEITVFWDEGPPHLLTQEQIRNARWRVQALVGNTEDIAVYEPIATPWGDAEYLIVCDSSFTDVMEPLGSFHENRGLTVEIATVQDILMNYSGVDDADRLRNFIRNRFQEHGTIFVLLAGDETLVPVRLIETECGIFYDYAPVDLYFADLDGTWDGNGDGIYGQPDDDLDLYADVLLGRALFSDSSTGLAEAAVFVQKNLMYQNSTTPGDWPSRAVLCGAVLFEDIGYTAAKGCDSIAATLPVEWELTKAYQVLGGDGIDTHIPVISSGTGWNYYGGHGNDRGIYWSEAPMGMMTNWIAEDSLHNGTRTGIHISIACHPAEYIDLDCCAEALLHKPDGGGVAVMFNTSYGWEGFWPSLGASEWMCIDLARQVFREQAPSLGLAFTTAKDLRIPHMHGGYDRTFQSLLSWSAFMDPALAVRSAQGDLPQPPVPLSITSPYPNPATRDAPVAFFVDYQSGTAHISVHDLAGRLLWETDISSPQRVAWEGTDGSGDRVPAGVYIISVRMADCIVSRLATILY